MVWERGKPGMHQIEDPDVRREWRRQQMRRRSHREQLAWYREWKRTGKIPDFGLRPFKVRPGSERRHPKGFLNQTMDGSDGEQYLQPRRGDYRKKRLVSSPRLKQEALILDFERMGAISLTTAFCFTCWERVRLVDGEAGPFSECEACGEKTGVEFLVAKREQERVETIYQRSDRESKAGFS